MLFKKSWPLHWMVLWEWKWTRAWIYQSKECIRISSRESLLVQVQIVSHLSIWGMSTTAKIFYQLRWDHCKFVLTLYPYVLCRNQSCSHKTRYWKMAICPQQRQSFFTDYHYNCNLGNILICFFFLNSWTATSTVRTYQNISITAINHLHTNTSFRVSKLKAPLTYSPKWYFHFYFHIITQCS